MRVLHVLPSFGLGGMEKIVCSFVDNSAPWINHKILALDGCTRAAGWITSVDSEIVPFERPTTRARFFAALFRAILRADADVLMTYNWGATDAIWLGRLAGVRKIVHNEHGFNVEEATTTLWKRDCLRFAVYHLSSKVVAVSHELERMLRKRFLLSTKKIRRIPNGIDTAYYAPDFGERQRVRKALGFRDCDCVLGFSGRLDPVKNLNFLLGIFVACKPRENPVRLLIVGDGPESQRLQARCYEQKIEPYVVFIGEQKEVVPYLRAMDVFLLTSLREQMPLTVLEAMSVGTAVVSTNVGEIPYVIDDGKDGFVRSLGAPAEVFAACCRLLFCPTRRRRMGEAAREKVRGQFKSADMVRRYTELLGDFA